MSSASHLLDPIRALHDRIRDDVVAACEKQSQEEMSEIAHDDAGDTIYAVDRVSEATLIEGLAGIAAAEPIVLVAEDTKGSVARITGLLSEADVNIATLKLTRKERGGDAFMVIEVDHEPGEDVRAAIRGLPWVRWAFRLDKVSA